MHSLLQSDVVVWIGVGYVIFVYGLLFHYAGKASPVDAIDQSTTTGHSAERLSPHA